MRLRWKGFEFPTRMQIHREKLTPTYGNFSIEPFERGFGVTIGHALRRVLLSSLTGAAVTTVVAAGGYPGEYQKGKPIRIPDGLERDDVIVFHAGTERRGTDLLTSGGRVLAVTALADSFSAAADESRAAAARISFEGAQHRTDIGWRERARLGRRT